VLIIEHGDRQGAALKRCDLYNHEKDIDEALKRDIAT